MSAASRKRWTQKRSEQRRLAREAKAGGIVPPVLPSPDLTAEELVDARIQKFERKEEYEKARKLIPIGIPVEGPYAITFFGDPHVDDDGTDWRLIKEHAAIVRETPAMFAANVGDTRNNWVGRLARLFGQQGTSAREALILAEHFLKLVGPGKWAFILGGNHDLWSGDDDPLEWIAGQINALYQPCEARVSLEQPGMAPVRVNARHDFKGNSQWNAAHAVGKAAQLGVRDDIMICGHKHQSGYNINKDPETGKLMHSIQVASYKVYDRYAMEGGFKDQHISPCASVVIDPTAKNPVDLIQVFWNPERAVKHLNALRG